MIFAEGTFDFQGTRFQVLTLIVLGLLFLRDLVQVFRGRGRVKLLLFRCGIWLAISFAVAFPNLVQLVASLLGIGRGADVVLYLLVFFFIGTSLYFYSRQMRQQQQITELVRYLAIREANRTPEGETSEKTP